MLVQLLPVLALLVRRPARGPRGSLLITAGVLGILATWLAVRVAWTVLSPPAELMGSGTFQALTFVLAAVVNGGLGYSLTNLQADRLLTQLQELAHTDVLTGLLSRRGLERALLGEVDRARRSGGGLWLAMFDVDHFKQINDRFGHLAGDELLRQVGTEIHKVIRPYDVAGRFGGDEFCVLALVNAPEDAANLGERLRRAIGSIDTSVIGCDCPVTTSVGMAQVDCASGNWQVALEAADRALYAAKAAGRNRVRLA
jgi:diguanylate cyclase (GGDEF)-like protein